MVCSPPTKRRNDTMRAKYCVLFLFVAAGRIPQKPSPVRFRFQADAVLAVVAISMGNQPGSQATSGSPTTGSPFHSRHKKDRKNAHRLR
jgi:hypothetical protein